KTELQFFVIVLSNDPSYSILALNAIRTRLPQGNSKVYDQSILEFGSSDYSRGDDSHVYHGEQRLALGRHSVSLGRAFRQSYRYTRAYPPSPERDVRGNSAEYTYSAHHRFLSSVSDYSTDTGTGLLILFFASRNLRRPRRCSWHTGTCGYAAEHVALRRKQKLSFKCIAHRLRGYLVHDVQYDTVQASTLPAGRASVG